MADPREEVLWAAGWRRIDGRWCPPAGQDFAICRQKPSMRLGFSLDDAVTINALIEATRRHVRECGR